MLLGEEVPPGAGALADSTFEPLGAGPLLQSVFLQLEAPTGLWPEVSARAPGRSAPLSLGMRARTWRVRLVGSTRLSMAVIVPPASTEILTSLAVSTAVGVASVTQ